MNIAYNKRSSGGIGSHITAVLLMIGSALAFSAMQLAIKLSGTTGNFPIMEQVFFRNIFALIVAIPILIRKGISLYGDKRSQKFLFGRSISGFLAVVLFFYATNHARIADANILNKLSPIVAILLSVVFFREHLSKTQSAALAVSFLGTWLICGPELNSGFWAIMAALASALFSGIAYTFLSALKDKADPMVVILHFSTFSVVCAVLCSFPNFVMPTWKQFLMLALIGLCGSLGQVLITYAYKLAPASKVSIHNYTGIIWSGLLGFFFLNETLPVSTIIGGGLIIAASVVNFLCDL